MERAVLKATIGTISSLSLLSAADTTTVLGELGLDEAAILGELGRDNPAVWGELGYRRCTEGHDGGRRTLETGGAVTGGVH
jgi:hypothetical protein